MGGRVPRSPQAYANFSKPLFHTLSPYPTVPAKCFLGLSVELVVTAANFEQACQGNLAKLATCPGECVGYVGDGNSMFPRQLLVRNIVIAIEIVRLKQLERPLSLPFNA